MGLRRNIAITFGTRYLELGVGFVGSMILARLLTPEDFGIYSIAGSIVLIGYLFRNFGVVQYLVQHDSLDEDLLRAAFSVTLIVSWAIGLILAAVAPFAGEFYGSDGVTQVLWFLALNFFLLPFGAVADAILRREMAFGKLAVISLSSAFAGALVGVVSAYFGARYLAIAWSANAGTLVTIGMTLYYRPKGLPWLPGIRKVREVMLFGAKVGTLDLVNKGSDSATEMLIGKVHGLSDLGIYSRAYGAFALFEQVFLEGVRPVVLPYLSEAKRASEDLGDIFKKIVNIVAAFMLPFFGFLWVEAGDVIEVLYGDQWGRSAPILQVMAVAGGLLTVTVFFEQLLIAKGRPGQALQYQVISQLARLGVLLPLLSGDVTMAAYAIVGGAAVRAALVARTANRLFSLSLFELVRQVSVPALITVVVVLWNLLGQELWGNAMPTFLRLVVLSLSTLVLWVGTIFSLKHPLRREILRLMPASERPTPPS